MLSLILNLLLSLIMASLLPGVFANEHPKTKEEILQVAKLSWSTGLLGTVLIAVGVLLCFFGRRFFKFFLAAAGFLSGGLLSFLILIKFEEWFTFASMQDHAYTIIVAVSVVIGLLGAVLCLFLWRVGVYALAGAGGFFLATWLMTLRGGSLIPHQIGRDVFIVLVAIACMIAAFFLETIVVVAASAIAGSNAIVIGLDCFINWGYKVLVLACFASKRIIIDGLTWQMWVSVAAVVVFAVIGAVVQFLNPAKGYGRGD